MLVRTDTGTGHQKSSALTTLDQQRVQNKLAVMIITFHEDGTNGDDHNLCSLAVDRSAEVGASVLSAFAKAFVMNKTNPRIGYTACDIDGDGKVQHATPPPPS